MERDFETKAEQEADKIAMQFSNSTDVIGDMSRAYHVDFSGIQIHTDAGAEQKVRSAGKDGLAQGNDLFFGRGILESNAPEDKMLVAHELAHTMQQGVTGGGMAVNEHVPQGTAQYSSKQPSQHSLETNIFGDWRQNSREEDDEEENTGEEAEWLDDDGGDSDYVQPEDNAEELREAQDYAAFKAEKAKTYQVHHFMTNKNGIYTPYFAEMAQKYGLDLDGIWNKERMEHQGAHPGEYHEFVYEELLVIDERAQKEDTEEKKREKFKELFQKYVKNVVLAHPQMLNKDSW